MIKEFEAFYILKDTASGLQAYLPSEISNACNIVKSALTELKQIKEAKPSEAMECLECNSKLFDEIALETPTTYKNETFVDAFLFGVNAIKIRQALLKAQELEKVLEVIFEKPLSLLVLKRFEKYGVGVSELEYQFFVEGYKATTEDIDEDMKEQIATEEEFDLLKRYIDNEKRT